MGLKVFWTDFSKKELRDIYEYHKENASLKVAEKLVLGIANETMKLANHPQIGQIEELLKNRNHGFRYLVYKNHKIIYWINQSKNRIEICDVFDTRQNPVKIGRRK